MEKRPQAPRNPINTQIEKRFNERETLDVSNEERQVTVPFADKTSEQLEHERVINQEKFAKGDMSIESFVSDQAPEPYKNGAEGSVTQEQVYQTENDVSRALGSAVKGPLNLEQAVLGEGIQEDFHEVKNDPDLTEEKREGYFRNIAERIDLVQDMVDETQGQKVEQVAQRISQQYDRVITEEPLAQEMHIEAVVQENTKNKEDDPELFSKNLQEVDAFYAQKFSKDIGLFSKKGSHGEKPTWESRTAAYKDFEKQIKTAGGQFPVTRKNLQQSCAKAAESQKRLQDEYEKFDGKKGWEKLTSVPGYFLNNIGNTLRHQNNKAKVYEDYLVDKIESSENYFGGTAGKMVSKGLIKGAGSVLRHTIPVVGLGLFFGFSWLLDIGFNKLRKIAEKRGNAAWLWKRKPAPKEKKKK